MRSAARQRGWSRPSSAKNLKVLCQVVLDQHNGAALVALGGALGLDAHVDDGRSVLRRPAGSRPRRVFDPGAVHPPAERGPLALQLSSRPIKIRLTSLVKEDLMNMPRRPAAT